MKFHSYSDPAPVEEQDFSDPFVDEFVKDYDDYHRPFLRKSGKRNLQEEINSFFEECDLGHVLLRYASGDLTALSKAQGVYTDIYDMPRDPLSLTKAFDRLVEFFELHQDNFGTFENFMDKLRKGDYSLGDESVESEVSSDVDSE